MGGEEATEVATPLSKRAKILPFVVGISATAAGIAMLVISGLQGSGVADFCLELGVAVALSGFLWFAATIIRGEREPGSIDYSALLIVGLIGAGSVAWAIHSGSDTREVLLVAGSAVATVWLFGALERQFVLPYMGDLPMWKRILLAPALPFILLTFRGFGEGWFAGPGQLDVLSFITDVELDAELDAWDRDSDFRAPGYVQEAFNPRAEDVARHLGVEIPEDFVAWVAANGGKHIAGRDKFITTAWPWQVINAQPVDAPSAVLVYADERSDRGEQNVFALDLRLASIVQAV